MPVSAHPASCFVVGTAHCGSFTVFPNDKHRQRPFFFALLEVPRECILYFLNILRLRGPCSTIIPRIALHHSFNMSGTSHSSTDADPEMTSYQLSSKPYRALRLEFQTLSGLSRPQLHLGSQQPLFPCCLSLLFPIVYFPIYSSRLQHPPPTASRRETCPAPPSTVSRT